MTDEFTAAAEGQTPGGPSSPWDRIHARWDQDPEFARLRQDLRDLPADEAWTAECWGCAACELGMGAPKVLVAVARSHGWSPSAEPRLRRLSLIAGRQDAIRFEEESMARRRARQAERVRRLRPVIDQEAEDSTVVEPERMSKQEADALAEMFGDGP